MKKQSGFTLVEGLLIVIAVGIIGFGGYYVWSQNQEDGAEPVETVQVNESRNIETVAEPSEPEVSISDDWERYESGQGAYSVKIADGLDGVRDVSDNSFIFRSYTNNTGAAVVNDINGSGSGDFKAIILFQREDSGLWNSEDIEDYSEEEFITTSGVRGTKSIFNDPYIPPCEGAGCYLGDKNVVYRIPNGSESVVLRYSRQVVNEDTVRIYGISQDSPDYSEEVEAMAKSIEIN